MKRINVNKLALTCALPALMALGGCAGHLGGGASPEDRVRERAQQRWDLLLSGDLNGAYQLLSPGQRSTMSSLEYQRRVS